MPKESARVSKGVFSQRVRRGRTQVVREQPPRWADEQFMRETLTVRAVHGLLPALRCLYLSLANGLDVR